MSLPKARSFPAPAPPVRTAVLPAAPSTKRRTEAELVVAPEHGFTHRLVIAPDREPGGRMR